MAVLIVTYDGEKFKPNVDNLNAYLVTEVMNGTNDAANDMMSAFGGIDHIRKSKYYNPKTDFLFDPIYDFYTLYNIADFYGIEWKYLRGVYQRYGLHRKLMPDDTYFIRGSTMDFLGIRSSNPSIPCGGVCSYSPRVALATAALICYGRTVPKDSVAQKVYQTLLRSSYYNRAKQNYDARNEVHEEPDECASCTGEVLEFQNAEHSDIQTSLVDLNGVQFNGDQTVTMSADVLQLIIRSAISEAANAFAMKFER